MRASPLLAVGAVDKIRPYVQGLVPSLLTLVK